MEVFLVSLLNGLVYGMLLFMLASGLTLIFSMMGVLNFAHASFFMLGAYFAFEISRIVGFWPALVVAPLDGLFTHLHESIHDAFHPHVGFVYFGRTGYARCAVSFDGGNVIACSAEAISTLENVCVEGTVVALSNRLAKDE